MESTTQISELPIKSNQPPVAQAQISDQVPMQESALAMDPKVNSEPRKEKRVTFEDSKPDDESKTEVDSGKVSTNPPSTMITNEAKLIILASFLFFIFIDNKFKRYIVDILTQIFGSFLKTESGGTSKIGNVFYSCAFGATIYLFTLIVDFASLQLSF